MELKDTIEDMLSSDYKKRFLAEYNQLAIRTVKLKTFIQQYKTNSLNCIPTCPISTLESQLNYMENYLRLLTVRANLEDIQLNDN